MTKVNELHQRIIPHEIQDNCRVSVIIPVRNEADNIVETLAALAAQTDRHYSPLDRRTFEIIVLANNCTDNSAFLIESFSKKHPGLQLQLAEVRLPREKSNVGYVRRWLMNEAHLRLRKNSAGRGVIMSTDGDTCVARNWIAANLREIENGAEAVGGRILLKEKDLKQMNDKARRFHLFDTGYRLLAAEIEARLDYIAHDYLPRHHQHFNGSFAVTTEAYERAGGVPAVAFLEDVAFFQSLMRVDARFRHSPQVRVETSSRIKGRTALGLSTQINEWMVMGEKGADYFVESALAISRRIKLRSDLRKFWSNREYLFPQTEQLAEKLLIPRKFLENELQTEQTFGELLEKIYDEQASNGEWRAKYPLVSVTHALQDLRLILEKIK